MDRGRPSLLAQLQEALALQPKFQPCLELPYTSDEEMTGGARDGAAHVLRCLKVWYDLPSDVLFLAVNLMDRFLTRMKVRPRHMACISASAFMLATRMVPGVTIPDEMDLIAISQCKCSLGDLDRMQSIISNKLDAPPHVTPVTPLTLARLLFALYDEPLREDVLLQLEILACDANLVNFTPSEIALIVLQPPSNQLAELQSLLGVSGERSIACAKAVHTVLGRYHAHTQVPHRQRLVWRLSQRTMRLLRPTDRLVRRLPTIDEQGAPADNWSDERPPATFHCDDDRPPSTFHCDVA